METEINAKHDGHNISTDEKTVGEKENINKKVIIAKYLLEMLNKTSEERPKRDEKIAYVWYCELQYWLAKRVETDFEGYKNNNGKNVGKIFDELDILKEEIDYVKSKWSKTIVKLAELTDFIGKEFKRRK